MGKIINKTILIICVLLSFTMTSCNKKVVEEDVQTPKLKFVMDNGKLDRVVDITYKSGLSDCMDKFIMDLQKSDENFKYSQEVLIKGLRLQLNIDDVLGEREKDDKGYYIAVFSNNIDEVDKDGKINTTKNKKFIYYDSSEDLALKEALKYTLEDNNIDLEKISKSEIIDNIKKIKVA